MFQPEMRFYVWRNRDGSIHVQNVVYFLGVRYGQHHVHTEKGFRRWLEKAGVKPEQLVFLEGECGCGLKPGDVREYDGRVWHNPEFE